MSEFNTGLNLYELNKSIMKDEQALPEVVIAKKRLDIIDFCKDKMNNYYMLLCNEAKDYTLFKTDDKKEDTYRICADEMLLCLKERGSILAIDRTKDTVALEVWLRINEEIFVYYFFGYDAGVIDCT